MGKLQDVDSKAPLVNSQVTGARLFRDLVLIVFEHNNTDEQTKQMFLEEINYLASSGTYRNKCDFDATHFLEFKEESLLPVLYGLFDWEQTYAPYKFWEQIEKELYNYYESKKRDK